LRASDFAGRFGGEELLVLLPDTAAKDAVALAERIRDTIASIRVSGVERAITVSIGVADLIQHGGDAPGLLRQADRALYTAKATSRNRVVVAGDDEPAAVTDEADDERASTNGHSAG
jgi:diguanylate cyclase (GGDEF)-like protein